MNAIYKERYIAHSGRSLCAELCRLHSCFSVRFGTISVKFGVVGYIIIILLQIVRRLCQ